ncbi:ABC transporter substrate-binding protein [Acuticoccus mangrovi]|uniref:Sugar ABC transporter substrate-binding protein n=1 Tax=Acuticoccus mangrovi TaxID=2796142 RepID=A0A934IPS4_9HYPH|nr:sugar ABC transporter substrate-binding protein [Acuticoccus mangrovi]MBJ3776363.1 sugar ABC transporter substrate-binding protein [Acuticoccus mangrovi]
MMRSRLTHPLKALGAAAALAALIAPAGAQTLTGAGDTGPVELNLVSCCKPTYFGPSVEQWNAKNPDIQIEQEVIPFAQLNDILESRIRAKDTTFDILILDPPRTASFAARRFVLDLTDVLGEKLAKTTNAESLEAVTYRDHLYAVPVFNSTQILIYNPEMLKEAGVEPPSIDPAERATWQEIIEKAKTVKEALDLPYGIAFSQGHTFYQLQPIIMSAGGGVGLTGDNMLTPEVNGDAWKEAMGWYGSLYADGLAPRGVPFPQMDALYTSGQLPFLATTTDRVREFQNQGVPFAVAAFPYMEGGEAYTPCDSFALAVNPFGQHQAQAVEFLTWLGTTEEGGFAAAAQSPNVPANLLVMNKVSDEMEAASDNLDGLKELIEYETDKTCAHRPASVGYVQFETEFLQANMDIINGADASSRLDQMQSQLEVALSRIR